MAEARTLKLDFMVKKWQNQKTLFGILIYALCRFQSHKNRIGRIDTLRSQLNKDIPKKASSVKDLTNDLLYKAEESEIGQLLPLSNVYITVLTQCL